MEKKLCEICHPKQWKTISSEMLTKEGYPVYGANGVIGYYTEYNHDKATLLITCRGATCGSLNISSGFSYINGNAMALDNLADDVDIRYLYYYLQGRGLTDTITGSAQPQIVRQSLNKVKVVYPTLSEQKMLVDLLDKVTALISLRQQQLEKLDQLVKSRFIEMFGDCENKLPLAALCSIITDGTHQPPKFQEKGIPFIFVSNLSANKITYNAEKYISDDTYNELIKRTPIEKGDVLLSTVGSYGHPAVVVEDTKFLFQRHISYLKPKHNLVNSFYLHSALLAPDGQRQIEEKVKGIAQKTLNLSEIKRIEIPLPSVEQQDQFAAFVVQVDKSKFEIQQSLEKLETLKKALMQKYFG
ncbi:MAG: restriction endonuclease subunit S [Oscillospiraceae bacterium]|nr:restriction endonuclease subunit S [Oscillospiraceae bacterium]